MSKRFWKSPQKQIAVFWAIIFLSTLIVGGVNADKVSQDISDSMRLNQYAQRYRVSEDEALNRMNLQSELALLSEELVKNEWEHIGGIWFEHEPEFKYVVAITGNEEQIRAYFDDQSLSDIVEIVRVDISLSELQELLEFTSQITADFETNHSTAIIQKSQVIEIRTVSRSNFLEEFEATVDVFSSQESQLLEEHIVVIEDETLDDLSSTAQIFAGHAITDCTSGWNVTRYGQRYGSTAGHCPNSSYYNLQYFGNVVFEADPKVSGVYNTDLQLHNAAAQGHSLSNDFEFSQKVVAQISKWGTEGSWVCKIGKTTGVTCGTIETVTASWGPGQPNTLIRVIKHNSPNPLACGGDSGAPLYSWQGYGYAAHGWVIGSACGSYSGNYMLVMPVNTAWGHGINVLTVP